MKTPPWLQVNAMSEERLFTLAAALLDPNSPHVTDQPLLARMKRLGASPRCRCDSACRAHPRWLLSD
jgi:hypothetical protein